MKIAILGYGEQGRAAFEYWSKLGNEITVCDQNESVKLPASVSKNLGANYLANLDGFDLIVRSPSVHPGDITKANGADILAKVTTVTNEFFKVCPTKNIIGVTGTKGKGTTSTLIAKMLEAAGKKVHLGGNIGIPPLDMLKAGIEPDDFVVLELANFQLIDLKTSPHIGVCLMVVPEHLDWHNDTNEYITSKQQLFAHQTEQDIAVYYGQNDYSQHIASVSKGQKIAYMGAAGADVIENKVTIDGQIICDVSEIKLLGKHNWQNVCAAVTVVWQIDKNVEAIKSVLTTFTGLEHRLELVREFNGVRYYDDSFGTTPETAIVAIGAFEQPKIVILGGSDKGATYDDLAKAVVSSNVRQVLLIGNTTNPSFKASAPAIEAALRGQKFDSITSTFKPGGITANETVQEARKLAQTGDVVLLSTGCASFDMFKNYKDRGEQFKRAVLALV